jgi:hypothetical protein
MLNHALSLCVCVCVCVLCVLCVIPLHSLVCVARASRVVSQVS